MATSLESAGQAYRKAVAEETAAKQALAAAQAARKSAAEQVDSARGPLAEAIVEAARRGVRQKDILAAIGDAYTRETVRRICRAAGVEPDAESEAESEARVAEPRRAGRRAQPPIPGADPDEVFGPLKRTKHTGGQQGLRGRGGTTEGPPRPGAGSR